VATIQKKRLLKREAFFKTVVILESFLFDPGFFTSPATQVEQAGTTNTTSPVDINLVDERRVERENPFHAYVSGNFPNRKGFGQSRTFDLNYRTTIILNSFLVTLTDFVMHRDGIAGTELRKFLLFS
jgi:hypothetical protein